MNTRAKSLNCVALLSWEEFNYGRGEDDPIFLSDDDAPVEARASVSECKVTVWLPKGARIVFRRGTNNEGDPSELCTNGKSWEGRHYYGSHDRLSRTRIIVRITPENLADGSTSPRRAPRPKVAV